MPPANKPRPTDVERTMILAWLTSGLAAKDAAKAAADGRARHRRLNRIEYANTIRDLLGVALDVEALPEDRDRLDQYFSAVRDVEQRLASGQEWVRTPKPKVAVAAPKDAADPADDLTRLRLPLDLAAIAFQTDSTRFITLYVSQSGHVQPVPGVSVGFHGLSHHSQDPDKLAQLKPVQTRQVQALAAFLNQLRTAKANGETVFDRTTALIGAAMGNASSHNGKNLPILLAGGDFKHGQHLAFDAVNNTPLCRLYVSILHRFGSAAEQFATGKGTLPGLELA